MQEKITLLNKSGLNLAALIDRDETLPKQKLTFIFGGFGSYKSSDRQNSLANLFQKNGYAVMRMDFRGRGESDGKMEDSTVAAGLEDADTMLDYALQLPWVDKDNLGLYGSSYGGAIAVLEAARRNIFKFVILVSPVSNASGLLATSMPEKVVAEAKNYDIYTEAQKIKTSVLVFHGTSDEVVPFNQSINLNKSVANSTLVPMTDYDHFYKRGFAPVEQKIEEFLKHV